MVTFEATFTESNQFNASFSLNHGLDAEFGEVIKIIDGDTYKGPYEVESKVKTSQTLETEGLFMTDDVTIAPVPIWRTGNVSGITVYIGAEE